MYLSSIKNHTSFKENVMKHFALSLLALLSLSTVAMAQDDVYFVPSQTAKQVHTPSSFQNAHNRSSFEYDNWAEGRSDARDVDVYNRKRKKANSSDTLFVEEEPSMTARIVRFRSPRAVLVASPWYDTYFYDLAYYDPWFNTWGWSAWYGYYAPWQSPWSWSSWYTPWPSYWHFGGFSPFHYGWGGYWGGGWYHHYDPWYLRWGGYSRWVPPAPRNQTFYGATRGVDTSRRGFAGRGESFGPRSGSSYSSRTGFSGSRSGNSYDLRGSRSSLRNGSYNGTRGGEGYSTPSRSGSYSSPSRSGVIGGNRGGYGNSHSTPSSGYSAPSRSYSAPSSAPSSSFGSGSRGGFGGGGMSTPSRSGVVSGRR